jgi:hypothetical protein
MSVYSLRKKDHYISYLDGKLYINNSWDRCTRSVDLETKEEKTIISKSSVCHNFFPFKHNGEYYAIGGQDNWKAEKVWKTHKTFLEFKLYFRYRFNKNYTRDENRWKHAQKRIIEECVSLDHSDGLYLLKLIDDKWTVQQRVIKADNPGFVDGRKWGKGAEFDGHLSVVNLDGTFFLYCRANPKKGIRRVQYATSKDLINWSEFKILKLDYKGYDYYYPCIFSGKTFLKAIFPVLTEKKSFLRYCMSTDGINWLFEKDFCHSPIFYDKGKPKNYVHPINGMYGDNILFHNNYLQMNKNKPVEVLTKKL